jgi:hypothetical protein
LEQAVSNAGWIAFAFSIAAAAITGLVLWAILHGQIKCSDRWCETWIDFLIGLFLALLMFGVVTGVTYAF